MITMKTILITLFSNFLTTSLFSAEPLYTSKGTDPSFAAVLKSDGIKVGERFSKGQSVPDDVMLFVTGVTYQ